MSPSRHTAEYPTKRIDYNNTYTEDIKTHLIRPGLTYALSVLILNALCVYFFEAFSPLKQFHITKITKTEEVKSHVRHGAGFLGSLEKAGLRTESRPL